MEFSQKKLLTFVVGIAILSGIARVVMDYIPRFLNSAPLLYYSTFFIAFILEIFIVIYAIKKYRKIKGSLTLVDALSTGVLILGIIGLFYCSMAYVYDTYLNPEFQKNMTIRFTEQFSPDQLEVVKNNLQQQDTSKSYLGVIMYTIYFIFLGTVISLVVGSALKTNE